MRSACASTRYAGARSCSGRFARIRRSMFRVVRHGDGERASEAVAHNNNSALCAQRVWPTGTRRPVVAIAAPCYGLPNSSLGSNQERLGS